jgi:lysophospholipase-2
MEDERTPAAGSGGFVVWLHGLGDCGRANEFIADHFSAAAFSDARWAFPTAPTAPVTCNRRCSSACRRLRLRFVAPVCFSLLAADRNSVCYELAGGMRMPSWFDIHDTPITSVSQNHRSVIRIASSPSYVYLYIHSSYTSFLLVYSFEKKGGMI